MIKTENLSMLFTTEDVQTKALNEVSLEIKKGEFVAIMGPSGCGKSTLLNILGTLDSSTSGKYFFDGKEIDKMSESQLTSFRKGNIGFVFQQYNLVPVLSVYENIVLPLRLDGAGIDDAFFDEVTALLSIREQLDRLPQMLSGGQQQRAAIARALMTKPAILLADEPTGSLDSVTSMEVVGLMRSCAERFHQTVIVVTHQEEVAQMADRVVRIEDGRLCDHEGKMAEEESISGNIQLIRGRDR